MKSFSLFEIETYDNNIWDCNASSTSISYIAEENVPADIEAILDKEAHFDFTQEKAKQMERACKMMGNIQFLWN
jgi:hypothetical protein